MTLEETVKERVVSAKRGGDALNPAAKRGPTMWIQIKHVRDRAIAVHIADNGSGMSPDVQQSVLTNQLGDPNRTCFRVIGL